MRAVAKAPASLGELIQGKIKGKEMLVSCPINRYSIAEVEVKDGEESIGINLHYEKVYKAFDFFLKRYEIDNINTSHIKVKIDSNIPRGKGMASSTADICSSLAALSHILSIPITEKEIAAIAVSVEPSDSIIFSNFTLFDHLCGQKIECIAPVMPMEFLLLEDKTTIDTVSFRKDKNYIGLVANMDEQYEKLKRAIRNKNIKLLGQICTESAFANQKLLYKSYLNCLYDIAMECHAPGINIAHSGSVSGIMISGKTNKNKLLQLVRQTFGDYFQNIYFTRTVKGGWLITYD